MHQLVRRIPSIVTSRDSTGGVLHSLTINVDLDPLHQSRSVHNSMGNVSFNEALVSVRCWWSPTPSREWRTLLPLPTSPM